MAMAMLFLAALGVLPAVLGKQKVCKELRGGCYSEAFGRKSFLKEEAIDELSPFHRKTYKAAHSLPRVLSEFIKSAIVDETYSEEAFHKEYKLRFAYYTNLSKRLEFKDSDGEFELNSNWENCMEVNSTYRPRPNETFFTGGGRDLCHFLGAVMSKEVPHDTDLPLPENFPAGGSYLAAYFASALQMNQFAENRNMVKAARKAFHAYNGEEGVPGIKEFLKGLGYSPWLDYLKATQVNEEGEPAFIRKNGEIDQRHCSSNKGRNGRCKLSQCVYLPHLKGMSRRFVAKLIEKAADPQCIKVEDLIEVNKEVAPSDRFYGMSGGGGAGAGFEIFCVHRKLLDPQEDDFLETTILTGGGGGGAGFTSPEEGSPMEAGGGGGGGIQMWNYGQPRLGGGVSNHPVLPSDEVGTIDQHPDVNPFAFAQQIPLVKATIKACHDNPETYVALMGGGGGGVGFEAFYPFDLESHEQGEEMETHPQWWYGFSFAFGRDVDNEGREMPVENKVLLNPTCSGHDETFAVCPKPEGERRDKEFCWDDAYNYETGHCFYKPSGLFHPNTTRTVRYSRRATDIYDFLGPHGHPSERRLSEAPTEAPKKKCKSSQFDHKSLDHVYQCSDDVAGAFCKLAGYGKYKNFKACNCPVKGWYAQNHLPDERQFQWDKHPVCDSLADVKKYAPCKPLPKQKGPPLLRESDILNSTGEEREMWRAICLDPRVSNRSLGSVKKGNVWLCGQLPLCMKLLTEAPPDLPERLSTEGVPDKYPLPQICHVYDKVGSTLQTQEDSLQERKWRKTKVHSLPHDFPPGPLYPPLALSDDELGAALKGGDDLEGALKGKQQSNRLLGRNEVSGHVQRPSAGWVSSGIQSIWRDHKLLAGSAIFCLAALALVAGVAKSHRWRGYHRPREFLQLREIVQLANVDE